MTEILVGNISKNKFDWAIIILKKMTDDVDVDKNDFYLACYYVFTVGNAAFENAKRTAEAQMILPLGGVE